MYNNQVNATDCTEHKCSTTTVATTTTATTATITLTSVSCFNIPELDCS